MTTMGRDRAAEGALLQALPWLQPAYDGACFTADLQPPGALFAAFVRAQHAHADILALERGEADADVLLFWTADDLPANIRPIPCIIPIVNRDGTDRADPPRTLMARGRCRHEGEILAMVVARTERAARRAAARARVVYGVHEAVHDAREAIASSAPQVWGDIAGNVCFDWEMGDRSACEKILREAPHVVRRRIHNNRVVIAPLETRNAIAAPVVATDSFVLVSATQGAHWTRDVIARDVLGWDTHKLEIITPRVGGSFGSKIFVYPEQVLTLLAAQALHAVVKWSSSRTEAFLSDIQGRDNDTDATIALDEAGRILSISVDTLSNLGAHLSNYAPFCATTCGAPLLCGTYQVGLVYARVRGVLTHTAPVDSYRGAGRPEAHYVVERMIDEAADELGFDRMVLRALNLIDETALPFKTATGIRIDSGMFRRNMQLAIEAANLEGFTQRQAQSAAEGRYRGFGVANFLETNGGFALARIMERDSGGLPRESARVAFNQNGRVVLDVGTQSSGQDHEGAYARILSEALGLPMDLVDVRQGRSDRLRQGTGTGGSKSMLSGSTAILKAADEVIGRMRTWLAELTGRDIENVHWQPGYLRIDDMSLTVLDAVKMARNEHRTDHPFDAHETATMTAGTYSNGCHICEVEVCPETGVVRVVRYVAVSDFGEILSIQDVKSQQYGGIAQGLGQALFEICDYDAAGRLCNGDLLHYRLPQADDMPRIDQIFNSSECKTNPLGVKGCGEAGASAAPPAIMNAVHHALRGRIRHNIQMPARPEAVWQALQTTSVTT